MKKVKEVIYRKLMEEAETIANNQMRNITLNILKEPKITFTKAEAKIDLLEAPAAPKKHHAYPGGLIEHTWAVLIIAKNLAEIFEKTYHVKVNRDLIVSSSILHDIFKFYQYERDPITGGFRPRSDWYLSHQFSIIAELSFRGAPEILIRCLAEMHGSVPTSMIESEIVKFADSVDGRFVSRIQDIVWDSCKDIELMSNGKFIAQKIYPQILMRKTIFELARTYYEKGRDKLTEYIMRELKIEL